MGESDEVYRELGDHLVEMLERHALLRPDSRVLDIGCGYGRLAHALLRRGFEGRYLGIDVLKPHIRWCSKSLGTEGVEFGHADLHNERYNPSGKRSVHQLDLGGRDFDVVCAFSVFTHMWPEDVADYMKVVSSALSPDGRALATFFLMDDEWRRLEAEGKVALRLPFQRGRHCRYESEEEPLHRVAYDLGWVVRRGCEAGLIPVESPSFGTWSWRPVDKACRPGYQDALIFGQAADI